MQTQTTQSTKLFDEQFQHALLMLHIARQAIEEVQEYREHIGPSLKHAGEHALNQMKALEKRYLNSEKGGNKEQLKAHLEKERTYAIATIIDQVRRVGNIGSETTYEEFLGILVRSIDGLVSAQTAGKNLHFSKYKALFQLIASELQADAKGEQGQVVFQSGKLWFGVGPNKKEIK